MRADIDFNHGIMSGVEFQYLSVHNMLMHTFMIVIVISTQQQTAKLNQALDHKSISLLNQYLLVLLIILLLAILPENNC